MVIARTIPALVAVLFVALAQARADTPKVTAVLTSSETALGEPVQLEIKITGTTNISPPDSIKADGLDIRFTGQSQNFEMLNLRTSRSVTLNYTVMPLKAGSFKIPPQKLRAGGNNVETPELTLRVLDSTNRSTGGATRSPSAAAPAGDEKLAFAELVVPKTSAYVGELVPVVLRVGFNSRVRLAQREPPHIAGQGFTTQKLSDEERNVETIDGRSYIVYSYKTAIAAARTGDFQIGPVETNATLLVPRRPSRPRHMPFDPFGDDLFNDPFIIDPFGSFAERRDIKVKSEPVALQIKPLPPGAPPAFSGAVGNFTIAAAADPKKVQIGDPITITAKISGRGNFDRVSTPVLSDERGWHAYPPSSNFKQDDDIGMSGEKSFEAVVSPTEKQTTLPPLTFSYFDPAKEKYVTLQTEAIPIVVEGNGAAAVPAPAVSPSAPSATTTPQRPADILHQINDRGTIVRTFAPLFARKGYWLSQLFPLAIVLFLIRWRVRRARQSNRARLRVAQWHRERDELLRQLRRDELAPRDYFSGASRIVQLKTALKENVEPTAVDAEVAGRAFNLDEQRQEELRRLFATTDELRYSGSGNGAVSPERRRETLELVESLA